MTTLDIDARARSVLEPLVANETVVSLEATLLLFLAWQFGSPALGLEEVIATPYIVAVATYDLLLTGEWVTDVVQSLTRIGISFSFAIAVGTVVGISMGLSDFWEKALQDYIIISMTLPGLFAIIFAAMYFGISDLVPMVAAGIVVFGFCALLIFQGVRNIDNRLIEMARSFGVSRRRVLRRVVLKGLLPEWFSATRYAFAVSWKIVLLAEFIAAERGIGWRILEQMNQLDLVGVLTWTVPFVAVMIVWEYGVLRSIEKRLLVWREDEEILGW